MKLPIDVFTTTDGFEVVWAEAVNDRQERQEEEHAGQRLLHGGKF